MSPRVRWLWCVLRSAVAVSLPGLLVPMSAAAWVQQPAGSAHRSAASALTPLPGLWSGNRPVTPTSWIAAGLERDMRFRLEARAELSLLARYRNPAIDRPAPWRRYYAGRYGASSWWRWAGLAWNTPGLADVCEQEPTWQPAYSPELSPPALRNLPPVWSGLSWQPISAVSQQTAAAPQLLAVRRQAPCPRWRMPRQVTLARYGGERDTFQLIDCDGSVAAEAIDRLSVLARPPGTPRPALPLPPEPTAAESGTVEWLPAVRMVHPRLVWVVQQLANAFPARPIYIISGYRPDDPDNFHRSGRALDLFVTRVANEELFRVCRQLHDVGCGYYPRSRFVHVDVRSYGSGHPYWIDASEPGMPAHYVDSWPGVIEVGTSRGAGAP